MSIEVLTIIKDAMADMGIEYDFVERKSKPVVYPYFIGEYQETESPNEDGMQESTFILDGFTRSTWLSLEEAKAKIKNYFNKVTGKVVIADNGSAVAIFYATSLVVPTGDAELKRIQINLTIKEWSVS